VFRAAVSAVPEARKALGLLATVGDQTGIEHERLFRVWRDHLGDGSLVQCNKVNKRGNVSGKGVFMVGTVAAHVAERDMPWQLWSREMSDGSQHTLEESHELSSWTGKLGNLTLEDDGSCGHLSLKKMSEVLIDI
jgi:hypothetical protein